MLGRPTPGTGAGALGSSVVLLVNEQLRSVAPSQA
jgi:hypothetical protein